jgi:hypothetical protein
VIRSRRAPVCCRKASTIWMLAIGTVVTQICALRFFCRYV